MLNWIKNIEYFELKIIAYSFQNQFSAQNLGVFCLKWLKYLGIFIIVKILEETLISSLDTQHAPARLRHYSY